MLGSKLNLNTCIGKAHGLIDDETGATFWPTNAGACFNANNARFRVADIDLAALYASADNDYMIIAKDGTLKAAKGYIDVADSEEAAPTEVLVDPALEAADEWDDTDANVTHNAVAGTVTWDGEGEGNFKTTAGTGQFTVGALYKIVVVIDSRSTGTLKVHGSAGAFRNPNNPNWSSSGAKTIYVICTHDLDFYLFGSATFDGVVSNISVKEVTHVGDDGVLIMSAKGGATQSWTSQDAGINLNDIATFDILIAK